MASVEEIKSRTDITEIVEQYLTLERSGSNMKACCPFHNERTPSFNVSSDRQMYYCFGCGVGGDVVDFVERMEGLDFTGAMRLLAEQAGLTFEHAAPEAREQKEELYEIMEVACVWYQSQLGGSKAAHAYLLNRGVSDASISVWRIGFVPDDWRGLRAYLAGKGYTDEVMYTAGLIKYPRDEGSGKEPFDTFRGRVMFPIADQAGRVVAFSGRILPGPDTNENAPKYLNSPETPIFYKSQVLYGFDKAKQAIRTMGYSVVVEGQLDLLLSHQHGFRNTVATSGTAVTSDHINRLKRLSLKLMLGFDADEAGITAVEKVSRIALGEGMEVKVAATGAGTDPADLLSRDPQDWKKALTSAEHAIDFLYTAVCEPETDERIRIRVMQQRVLPLIGAVQSKSEQAYFVRRIAQRISIREEAVWSDMESLSTSDTQRDTEERQDEQSQPAAQHSPSPDSRKQVVIGHLVALLEWQQQLTEAGIDADALEQALQERLGEELEAWRENVRSDPARVFSVEQTYGDRGLTQEDINELLRELEIVLLKEHFDQAAADLAEAERHERLDDADTALKQCHELRARIDQLTERNPSVT